MITKVSKIVLVVMFCGCLAARAALYQETFNSGFANSGSIPDGNTAGWSDSETLSGISGNIGSISINLNIQGGYNGDLYGYLSYNGTLVTLLNRVGVGSTTPGSTPFGYGDSGFNITLSSSAANNVHFYQNVSGYNINANGQLTGTWAPDGSAVNPVTGSPSAYDTGTGAQTLNSFDGMSANGTWTLFIADVSGGGGTSQLISYELDITTVPEQANVALFGFGGVLGLGALARFLLQQRRLRKSVSARD